METNEGRPVAAIHMDEKGNVVILIDPRITIIERIGLLLDIRGQALEDVRQAGETLHKAAQKPAGN
jgi:hypothetical protein